LPDVVHLFLPLFVYMPVDAAAAGVSVRERSGTQ
jgi:hypothetical protein